MEEMVRLPWRPQSAAVAGAVGPDTRSMRGGEHVDQVLLLPPEDGGIRRHQDVVAGLRVHQALEAALQEVDTAAWELPEAAVAAPTPRADSLGLGKWRGSCRTNGSFTNASLRVVEHVMNEHPKIWDQLLGFVYMLFKNSCRAAI